MRHSLLRIALFAGYLMLALAPAAAQAQTIGSSLQDAIATASPTDLLEVVVTFEGDGPLTTQHIGSLRRLGLSGILFQSLPIAGVKATPLQIERLQSTPGLRSLWLNEVLRTENDTQTAATGVDRLREDASLRTTSGLPFSGRGVGVLVNDSGIDATHPDLKDNVVENVAGQANLNSVNGLLPMTWVGGIPNTDNGGGHGTHVAGILAGTGAASGGKFEGVAPGADIIGYGSGAVVLVLDALGGFDYALTHQNQFNIRVVSNSFGESNDNGTDFQPDHPTNIATKRLADRGIIVVFSAGNSGPVEGTITGNYKKAPWVVTVAASDSQGRLGSFSSRGRIDQGGSFTGRDGLTYEWSDRPTITAPGEGVVSANASTGTLHYGLHPEFVPYYAVATGTSMACPHVAGIVAMMLEADPTLSWREVKDILQSTATNMSATREWETGAGFVNAHAAVKETVLRRDGLPGLGVLSNSLRSFNANATLTTSQPSVVADVEVNPLGGAAESFEVYPGTELVSATASIGENTAALVLTAPDGSEYVSAVSVPGYQAGVKVTAPAQSGTWTLSTRGLNSWVGLRLDMLGLTNGIGLPGSVRAQVAFFAVDQSGLNDLTGREDASLLLYAVSRRLVDGDQRNHFRADRSLNRLDMARYLTMGASIRLAVDDPDFGPIAGRDAPFIAAVSSPGGALMDTEGSQSPVMLNDGASFGARRDVTRQELAFSLVQSLGMENEAQVHGDAAVKYEATELSDAADIDPALRGHVQLALDLGLLPIQQGPEGSVFGPREKVRRAAFALAMIQLSDGFMAAPLPDLGLAAKSAGPALQSGRFDAPELPKSAALEQNYPNPFSGATTIRFIMPESGNARLTVFDQMGRQVARLIDGILAVGSHSVRFESTGLAAGAYLYRLEHVAGTSSRVLVVSR